MKTTADDVVIEANGRASGTIVKFRIFKVKSFQVKSFREYTDKDTAGIPLLTMAERAGTPSAVLNLGIPRPSTAGRTRGKGCRISCPRGIPLPNTAERACRRGGINERPNERPDFLF